MKRSKIVETVTAAFLVASLVSVPGAAARLLSDADVCLQPFHQHRDVSAVDSLLVSELAVLRNAFTLKEVMTKLARDSREPGITAQDVWREWWDTQNFGPGLGMGIHCDDNGMIEGEGVLNGFPVQCPRAEGQEIALVPFLEDNPAGPHYELIALVNRFDMAPSDGRHCGEYRAIFARMQPSSSGGGGSDPAGEAGDDVGNSPPATGRNLVIFEAVVPNPSPGCGLEGCRAIAEYWEQLSSDPALVNDPVASGRHLRRFFLRGLANPRVPPAISLDHMTKGTGQLRTNMFLSPEPGSGVQRIWQLRDFKLARICNGPGPTAECRFQVVPVSVKGNPFGELFGEDAAGPGELTAFQRAFVSEVRGDALMHANVNAFGYAVDNVHNAGESNAQGIENDYPANMPTSPRHPFLAGLRESLAGFSATPTQAVRRAHVLSCGGCHNPPAVTLRPPVGEPEPDDGLGSGLFWEDSNGFTHVSELGFDPDIPQRSWLLSDALKRMFLPHRERVFERFLGSEPCEPCASIVTAGNRSMSAPSSTIVVGEGEPLFISSEDFQALEEAEKVDDGHSTVGGSARVH
ncbi:MAG: hypothetical protein VCC68_01305 [Myxococcota bacterium]